MILALLSQIRLNSECSVFRAELIAIEFVSIWLRDSAPVYVGCATFYTGSQSVTQAINKFNNTNPIIAIHTDNTGNELANTLASAAPLQLNHQLETVGNAPLSRTLNL